MPTSEASGEESDAEVEQENENEVNTARTARYLAHLQEHMNHTRRHLASDEHTSSLAPSFFAPNSYWTGLEKERFFHGLSVHSRLRPDLIAQDIGTKSLMETCVYLDMLDEALAEGFGMDDVTSSKRKYTPVSRRDFPIAHEVSDEWVAREDGMAVAAIEIEPLIVAQGIEARREEEKKLKRGETRAKRGTAKGEDQQRDRKREAEKRKQLEAWIKEKEAEWKVVDASNALDDTTLRAIDAILREDEEASVFSERIGSESRQTSVAMQVDDACQAAQAPDTAMVDVEPAEEVAPDADDMIDPALRESFTTRPPDVIVPQTEGMVSEEVAAPRTPQTYADPYSQFNPSTPPFALPPPLSEPMVQEPSMSTSMPPPTESTASLVSMDLELPMSPATRRRMQKRLHMRRKRAAESGQVADDTAARLKPGRKAKKEKKPGQSVSGPTKHVKAKTQLELHGLDAAGLREKGLGLFRMGNMAKLMQTYNKLHDVDEDVNSHIAIDTIRALRELVVRFITKLVRQAIVSREQEMLAKTQTKVWRLGDSQTITTVNVAHALSLIQTETRTIRSHFDNLLPRLGFGDLSADEEEDEARDNGDSDEEEDDISAKVNDVDMLDEDEDDEKPAVSALPAHRAIFPPFVRLPRNLRASDASNAIHLHIPWSTSFSTYDTLDHEDSPSDGEEELDAELAEESGLDDRDSAQDDSYEKTLWGIFDPPSLESQVVETQLGGRAGAKRKRRQVDGDVESVKRRKRRKVADLATCEPGGRVKSAAYIEDSD